MTARRHIIVFAQKQIKLEDYLAETTESSSYRLLAARKNRSTEMDTFQMGQCCDEGEVPERRGAIPAGLGCVCGLLMGRQQWSIKGTTRLAELWVPVCSFTKCWKLNSYWFSVASFNSHHLQTTRTSESCRLTCDFNFHIMPPILSLRSEVSGSGQ